MTPCLRHTALATLLTLAHPAQAGLAYVSNEKDNTLSVIDTDSMTVVDTVPVGQRPRGILLSKDHTRLYICASDDDTVQVMDLASRPDHRHPALGRRPGAVRAAPQQPAPVHLQRG